MLCSLYKPHLDVTSFIMTCNKRYRASDFRYFACLVNLLGDSRLTKSDLYGLQPTGISFRPGDAIIPYRGRGKSCQDRWIYSRLDSALDSRQQLSRPPSHCRNTTITSYLHLIPPSQSLFLTGQLSTSLNLPFNVPIAFSESTSALASSHDRPLWTALRGHSPRRRRRKEYIQIKSSLVL